MTAIGKVDSEPESIEEDEEDEDKSDEELLLQQEDAETVAGNMEPHVLEPQ
jgi:hypothetical protein